MALAGSNVGMANYQLRFFLIIFLGIMAFGSVLYWRQKTLEVSTYTDFPTRSRVSSKNADFKSQHYQIDVEDTSPAVE